MRENFEAENFSGSQRSNALFSQQDMTSFQDSMRSNSSGSDKSMSAFPNGDSLLGSASSDKSSTDSSKLGAGNTITEARTERNCPGGGTSGDGGRDCEDRRS